MSAEADCRCYRAARRRSNIDSIACRSFGVDPELNLPEHESWCPALQSERLKELERRMWACVTGDAAGSHATADEILLEAVRLLPGGEELASIYERANRRFGYA